MGRKEAAPPARCGLPSLIPSARVFMSVYVRNIQITVDERLLRRLDSSAEAKREGRSAVIRRALEAYLERRRSAEIDDQIRRGYRAAPRDPELDGWAEEGAWPDE